MSHAAAAAAPDDVALAQALMEEETTLATASTIELARKLAERPAPVYQEIALEEGQRNLAQAQAQVQVQQSTSTAADEAATAPPEQQEAEQEPTSLVVEPRRCLTCDTAEHLSEIQDVGYLCFSCLQHNCGAELGRLVFS